MERLNAIIIHPLFELYVKRNKRYEKDRKFCRHDIEHFLDVARIAYILNLEKNLNYDKEIIYASAMLHDITKWLQYKDGVPHDKSVVKSAMIILYETGFHDFEIDLIVRAIKDHRNLPSDENSLGCILYKADKLSRMCFECDFVSECNWNDDKKNFKLKY